MKKIFKDPRVSLDFFIKLPIILLSIFYIYFNFKQEKIFNLLIFISIIIVIMLVASFLIKKKDYKNIIFSGYIAGGSLFLLGLFYIIAAFLAGSFNKFESSPFINLGIVLIVFILSFSIFYLTFKSTLYERNVLKIKRIFNYIPLLIASITLFILFIMTILLLNYIL